MSDLATIRPKGNALVPSNAPILPPQLFVDFCVALLAEGILNKQKLSLSPTTPLGAQVSVSDGFAVSGAGTGEVNKAYFTSDSSLVGQEAVYLVAETNLGVGFSSVNYGTHLFGESTVIGWFIFLADGTAQYCSSDNVTDPWLVTSWQSANSDALPTLTHPAVQSLAAASTTQGGVFVSGGTQDGVSKLRTGLTNGRLGYCALGHDADPFDAFTIGWGSSPHNDPAWEIMDVVIEGSNSVYYSLDDVATPDLCTTWYNASDDSPASITVTIVTQGELAAGLQIGDVTYPLNGNTNGRGKYSDVLGMAADVTWDGTKWTDGTTNGTGNTAFPWDAGLGVRDDVAAEANWHIV